MSVDNINNVKTAMEIDENESNKIESNDNLQMETNQLKQSINYMPFSIDYNGPAPISNYFLIREENDHPVSSFRGHTLKGIKVQLPEHIKGYVTRISTDDSKKLLLSDQFDSLCYWEHDTQPQSQMLNELDWMEISEAVSLSKSCV